jgi:hypothetical protein
MIYAYSGLKRRELCTLEKANLKEILSLKINKNITKLFKE